MPALEPRLRKAIYRALEGLPVHVAQWDVEPATGYDARAHLLASGREIVVDFEWVGQGYPHELRRAVGRSHGPGERPVVLAAQQFSRAAINELRRLDVNYVDLAGQARLALGDALLILREPDISARDAPSPSFRWSPSALTVAEAMLADPELTIRTKELADRTGWTPQRVSQVLAMFDSRGWTSRAGPSKGPMATRKLIDRDVLLEDWANEMNSRPRQGRMAHVSATDTLGVVRRLAPALSTSWMLTGWVAAQLLAPIATAVPTAQIYLPEEHFDEAVDDALELSGLPEVDEGGRIALWPADRHALRLAGTVDDLPIASVPRVYADLRQFAGRGPEIAEHLMANVLPSQADTDSDAR